MRMYLLHKQQLSTALTQSEESEQETVKAVWIMADTVVIKDAGNNIKTGFDFIKNFQDFKEFAHWLIAL